MDSPVPVRFVSLEGDESSAAAGRSEFVLVATVTGTITVFNLIWWSLRILGLRPFLLPALHITDGAGTPTAEPQPACSGAPRPATNPWAPAGDQGPPPSLIQLTTLTGDKP